VSPKEALAFVKRHGIVLQAARGPVPSLAEAVAGGRIRGSWWSHPKAHEIFRVLAAVRDSGEVLVCRVIAGKVTLVHRRLWPALIRCAGRIPRGRLAAVREEHSATGRHVVREIPFARWPSSEARREASDLEEDAAVKALGAWIEKSYPAKRVAVRPRRR